MFRGTVAQKSFVTLFIAFRSQSFVKDLECSWAVFKVLSDHIDRQPRDIGVDELGTNDRVLECTEGLLGMIEIHFWQGPSTGYSQGRHPKGPKNGSNIDEHGTN